MAGSVRRIQLVGGSTYIVSLPKEWVENHRLGKGSQVMISTLPDGSLLLKPLAGGGRPERRAVVEARGGYGRLLRAIISSYIAGARVIEVRYSVDQHETVMEVVGQISRILLGVEMLDSEPGLVRLYSVLDDYAVSFRDAYAKMRRGVEGMLESLTRGLEEENKVLITATIERDDLVDRLYLYLARQMTRALLEGRATQVLGISSTAEAPYLFLALKSMERIGDHATIIARIALSSGVAPLRPHLDIVREVASTVHTAAGLLPGPGPGAVEEAQETADKASVIRRRVRETRDRSRRLPEVRALDSMERIAGYTQDMAEAVINIASIRASIGQDSNP
ncbi:MAG: phosphate uptake regulator PhoU [Desulfurococcales archaeon]|nr:phosphate uptake regulator PhoU [Desulfurococcales archaeon]